MGLYRVFMGLYRVCMEIMERKLETTIMGYITNFSWVHHRVWGIGGIGLSKAKYRRFKAMSC